MKILNPNTVDLIFWSLQFIGGITAFLGTPVDNTAIFIIGIAIIIIGWLFRLVFFRCPHCGKRLSRSQGEICPYCNNNILQ